MDHKSIMFSRMFYIFWHLSIFSLLTNVYSCFAFDIFIMISNALSLCPTIWCKISSSKISLNPRRIVYVLYYLELFYLQLMSLNTAKLTWMQCCQAPPIVPNITTVKDMETFHWNVLIHLCFHKRLINVKTSQTCIVAHAKNL